MKNRAMLTRHRRKTLLLLVAAVSDPAPTTDIWDAIWLDIWADIWTIT